MEKEIKKILFNRNNHLDVEVIDFAQLSRRLNQSNIHNPFVSHRIDFYCILIVTSQSYSHFVDFKSYELSKGSAIFVAKNQVHNFTKSIDDSGGYCIVFSSLFMDKRYSLSVSVKFNRLFNYHIESPAIHQDEIGEDDFIEIANQIYEEYSFPNEVGKVEILQTLLHLLLLKAERAKEVSAISSVQIKWLETFSSFKDLLEKEYVNTRSSRAYANRLFVSYKLLNDVVKKMTGKTVKVFIDDFIIIEIKRYLVSTSLSVKEIGYKSGFKDPANMIKFFKKNTSVTPLKYRQSLQ